MEVGKFIPNHLKEDLMRVRFTRYGFLLRHANTSVNGSRLWLMIRRKPHFKILTHQPYTTLWSFVREFPMSLPKEVFENRRVVDVGSYIGDSTIYFIKECSSRTVIAYEPQPLFFGLLKSNMRINSLQERVHCINKAVTSTMGRRSFRSEERASRLDEQGECVVETESFEKIVDYAPDIVKLDCEGCEHEIINKTPKDSFRKIKEYVIEVHGSLLSFVSSMKSLGYDFKLLSHTRSPIFQNLATIYFKRR